jgi:predicted acyltransferase
VNSKELQDNIQPGTQSTGRLISLDVFRGMTIMGMILVNNPGTWSHVYPPLRHAEWHGCTFTDLIFPFFLFIVGTAMAFSFAKWGGTPTLLHGKSFPHVQTASQKPGFFARFFKLLKYTEQGNIRTPLIKKIIRRTLILFALGLLLNWFPYFDIAHGRIPGVLQRIALCYFLAAWIFLKLKPRTQWLVTFSLMAVHWIGLTLVPVPGYGAGVLEPQGNLCGYIDSILLNGHTYIHAPAPGFDPEGIFSTFTALATTMLGVFAGNWLRSQRSKKEILIGIFAAANIGLAAGYVLTAWMPLNKNMWAVSYVFFTAGLAMHVLAMCYWLIDLKGFRRWAVPFVVFGSNAIFVYVLSSLASKLLKVLKLQSWLYRNFFQSWAGDINGSLAFAVTYVSIWLGIAYLMYRKKIFIKV